MRIQEVTALLDDEALHRFSLAEIDAATKTAIDGLLLQSADPYAEYYTPEAYRQYQALSNSEFVGIGIAITANAEGKPEVSRVYANSPAEDQGVLRGDVILAIDNERKDWHVEDAVNSIRRSDGEQVTIVWQRNDSERTTTMAVRKVSLPTVSTQLIELDSNKIGYLYLSQFSPASTAELKAGIQDMENQGATALVLDLRDNPGGLL